MRKKNRKPTLGKNEKAKFEMLIKEIRRYKITKEDKKARETRLNDRLQAILKHCSLNIQGKSIPTAKLFDETFRPEFFLTNRKQRNVCAVECKKLTETRAKATWKEGLSQALHYSLVYKCVVLVLYDYTKNARFHQRYGRGNTAEHKLGTALLKKHRIKLLILKPA